MTEPRWLTDEQQRAWRAYLAAHTKLNAHLNRVMQTESGLSLADFAVLVQLTDQPTGAMRTKDLAQALEWEKSRLSHHLARMRQRDLVARRECPEDGRSYFIHITQHGRNTIKEAAPSHVEAVKSIIFDRMTDSQTAELRTICETILDGIDAQR